MLNKIAKATNRYPRTQNSKRAASQLNANVRKLQEKIKEAGATSNPIPVLREVHQSPLFVEVLKMLNEISPEVLNQPNAHSTPELRALGHGATICSALNAVVNIMGRHYNLTRSTPSDDRIIDRQDASNANDRAFQQQIKPKFENELKSNFKTSWNRLTNTRTTKSLTEMAGVLSAIAPDALADLKLSVPPEALELARQWGDIAPEMQLNKSELLALIDYVDSETDTFNASNNVALANAYYGEKVLADVMQVFTKALNGAVNKLCAHPHFGLTNITAYKGVLMGNTAGPFRLRMLESAVGTGKLIAFPQVLSATSHPEQSYAAKKYAEGYHYECELTLKNACAVDFFHDSKTRGEMEVIAPAGQKFIVTGKKTRETYDPNGGTYDITQFVLVPAETHL